MSGPPTARGEDAGPTATGPPEGTGERASKGADDPSPEGPDERPPEATGRRGDAADGWTVEGAIPEDGAVVLFDGVCNLCSGVVGFVIPRDPEGNLRFASLQSAAAERLLADYGREPGLDSVVLVTGEGCYTKSAAILRMATYLERPWPLARFLRAIPRVLRDAVYDLVAASRYRVFGKKDRCMVPSEDVRSRFLEDPTGAE